MYFINYITYTMTHNDTQTRTDTQRHKNTHRDTQALTDGREKNTIQKVKELT